MYKVVILVSCNIAGSSEEVEEIEFETLEKAQEYVDNFVEDELWQLAIEHIQPEAWLEIRDEDANVVN